MQDPSGARSRDSFRVLQAITPSRMGGAEMMLVRMAPRLRERGHQQNIVCNSTGRGRDALGAALQQQGFDLSGLPIGGKANPRALFALHKAAKNAGCQFSHSHLSSASWWCGWLDRLGLLPSVGHVHGFTSPTFHRHQRRLLTASRAVRDHLIENGISAERITVLPLPVAPEDVAWQKPAEQVQLELNIPQGAPLVGSFAGLLEKKGWREWLEAVPLVLREHPQTHFLAVGEGPLRAELEARTRELGIDKHVHFLGFRADVADVMNAVDIMALPSHREPFGLVYVEAALLGKPCVACNAGGAPEIIEQGQSGLLVAPRDSQAIAGAINELLGDPARAVSMGQTGRELALQKFGWAQFLPALEEVYASLVA